VNLDPALAARVDDVIARVDRLVGRASDQGRTRADLDRLRQCAQLLRVAFEELRARPDVGAREARHNLRNPLAAVIGYSELIVEDLEPAAPGQDLLDVREAALAMLEAVDRLVD
jgi:signal transduction histidine kinase